MISHAAAYTVFLSLSLRTEPGPGSRNQRKIMPRNAVSRQHFYLFIDCELLNGRHKYEFILFIHSFGAYCRNGDGIACISIGEDVARCHNSLFAIRRQIAFYSDDHFQLTLCRRTSFALRCSLFRSRACRVSLSAQ